MSDVTNITAAVLVTVSTVWTNTGTFVPKSGSPMDVQVSYLVTNTTAHFVWKDQKRELILEQERGPDLPGERRVPRPFPQIGAGGTNQMIYPPLPKP